MSSELPYDPRLRDAIGPADLPFARAAAPLRRREPVFRYLVLLGLTVVTTTLVGAGHYAEFVTPFGEPVNSTPSQLLLGGLWYGLGVIAILGAHELGHYFACRYYRVNASRPYFIPLWIPAALFGMPPGFPWWTPLPTPGTLGAVIRIRQPIATKRQFFDIGIAGPIAGFVVLVPVLAWAMSVSDVAALPPDFRGINFGEPLLFRLTAWFVFGDIPADSTIKLHPAGWAAWFGMLATALNLAPVGQLDGGHISYAVFGRRSSLITILVTVLLVGLLTVSTGYVLWTILVVVMVLMLGPHHPRTFDEAEPLDAGRLLLAAFAVVIFVLCFTPVPVELVGI